MLIILEGIDGSGKTTLSKKLSEKYKLPVIKFSYPKNDEEKNNMFLQYLKILYNNNFKLILDRSWISEIVYGNIMRDSCVLSDFQVEFLNYLVNLHNGRLYYCDIGAEKSYNNAIKRGEDYITNYHIHLNIYKKYLEVIPKITIKDKIEYNYEKEKDYEY